MGKTHYVSHELNRLKICLYCLGKTKKMYPIAGDLKEKLLQLSPRFKSNVNDNNSLPSAICSSCRRKVFFANQKDEANVRQNEFDRLPELDTSKFTSQKKITRNNLVCDCYLCELARKSKCNSSKII